MVTDGASYISGIVGSRLIITAILRLIVTTMTRVELPTTWEADQAPALIVTAYSPWTFLYRDRYGLPFSVKGLFIFLG